MAKMSDQKRQENVDIGRLTNSLQNSNKMPISQIQLKQGPN
jgi:hypothetical protein